MCPKNLTTFIEGDSPQCGEMSRSDKRDGPCQGGHPHSFRCALKSPRLALGMTGTSLEVTKIMSFRPERRNLKTAKCYLPMRNAEQQRGALNEVCKAHEVLPAAYEEFASQYFSGSPMSLALCAGGWYPPLHEEQQRQSR